MGRYEYRTVFSHCPLLEDDFERLACEIKELMDATEVFLNKYEVYGGTSAFYEANPWTIVKLLFLKMYIRDVYTPIIGRKYPSMVYIDLFSGPGVDRFKINRDRYTVFFGSPLIAAVFASYPFTKIILNDLGKWTDVLEQRMRAVAGDSVVVFRDDANSVVNDVKGILKGLKNEYGGTHFLAFLDPEGLELRWKTIRTLISLEKEGIAGDFIVLFQGYEVARNAGVVRKHGLKNKRSSKILDRLNDFFCNGAWLQICREQDHGLPSALLKLYMDCFAREKSKAIVEEIPIELSNKAKYWLIYATRVTSRGSPYMESVRWLKKLVEGNPPKLVKSAVLRALGSKGLNSFYHQRR